MKGFLDWLGMILPKHQASETRSEQDSSDNDERTSDLQIDDLMADNYGESTDETTPHLRVIKHPSQATGFDPYDTAKMHKK
jgi:hypothetical protein